MLGSEVLADPLQLRLCSTQANHAIVEWQRPPRVWHGSRGCRFRPRGAGRYVRPGSLRGMQQRISVMVKAHRELDGDPTSGTISPRCKLELAFRDGPKVTAKEDVEESTMLEAYRPLCAGDGGEKTQVVNLAQMFSSVPRRGAGKSMWPLWEDVGQQKPNAFRADFNLLSMHRSPQCEGREGSKPLLTILLMMMGGKSG